MSQIMTMPAHEDTGAKDRPSTPGVWKLTPAIALIVAVALLVAGAGVALYGERSYRAQKINEVSVQARILASTVTAALAFSDRDAAQEYASALKANPEVQAAAIYDSDGSLFVSYSRTADIPLPKTARAGKLDLGDDHLTVTVPVMQGASPLGTVYLRANTESTARRLERYGVIVLLVTMASLVVGVLGVAQAALSKANSELETRVHQRTRALETANERLGREISERKDLEHRLSHAQKMETVGQLTGGVAHDFNNLLGIVTANLDLLIERLDGDAQSSELAQDALDGALRGAELTQRMLAFARKQPLQPTIIDLNEVLPGMTAMLQRTVREDIAIDMAPGDRLWRALCDKSQVENVILNLAINARDAMPAGGRLLIETANIRLDQAYAAQNFEVTAGDYVMLAIADSGTGMAPEVMERVFEPFFTTKPVGHGSGLGLSMVYGFVKQSGGHIKIYSEVGHGTTVRLYLPRAGDGPDISPEDTGAEIAARAIGTETVLVVEDDLMLRRAAVKVLGELGYAVREADSAQSALRVMESGAAVDLLFTDVVMPGGMTGVDLVMASRERRPALKALLTTGYSEIFVKTGNGDGNVDLIGKPYRKRDLAAKIRSILDEEEASR
jgi:signal transduction histidine kinase/ActR/RegA family two-component response regulator